MTAVRKETLRDAQKAFTRQRLLDGAVTAIDAKGYVSATIDDIVGAAGTTRATFYLHFASKADLAEALREQMRDGMADLVAELPLLIERLHRAAVRDWLNRAIDFWEEHRGNLRTVLVAEMAEPNVAVRADEGPDNTISAIVAGFERAGRFTAEERVVRAVLMHSQAQALHRRYVRVDWDMDRDVVLDAITTSWVALAKG